MLPATLQKANHRHSQHRTSSRGSSALPDIVANFINHNLKDILTTAYKLTKYYANCTVVQDMSAFHCGFKAGFAVNITAFQQILPTIQSRYICIKSSSVVQVAGFHVTYNGNGIFCGDRTQKADAKIDVQQ